MALKAMLSEAAGITVGSWYAWPSTRPGYELVAAGMLIMAAGNDGKPVDYDELRCGHASGSSEGCGHARANGEV